MKQYALGVFRPKEQSNAQNIKNLLPAVGIEDKEQFYLAMAKLPEFDKKDFNDGRLGTHAEQQENR